MVFGAEVEEPSSVFEDDRGSMVLGAEVEEPSSVVEDDRDLRDDHAVPQFSAITEFDSPLGTVFSVSFGYLSAILRLLLCVFLTSSPSEVRVSCCS